MPTRADFIEAEATLRLAADAMGEILSAARAGDPAGILHGGSLARQVAHAIDACAVTATTCQDAILEVAEVCRERAGVIAAYERALTIYRIAYEAFSYRLDAWRRDYDIWYVSEGATAHPGPVPVPPPRPAEPPAWADVDRL